jgi:hypothetical protein
VLGCLCGVQVLTTGYWPAYPPMEINVPPSLAAHIQRCVMGVMPHHGVWGGGVAGFSGAGLGVCGDEIGETGHQNGSPVHGDKGWMAEGAVIFAFLLLPPLERTVLSLVTESFSKHHRCGVASHPWQDAAAANDDDDDMIVTLVLSLRRFEKYYTTKYQGRRLMWQHSLGTCIVKSRFRPGTKELSVSLFQALCLLCFNLADVVSFREIKAQTNIEDSELRRTLQSLACGKVGTSGR